MSILRHKIISAFTFTKSIQHDNLLEVILYSEDPERQFVTL